MMKMLRRVKLFPLCSLSPRVQPKGKKISILGYLCPELQNLLIEFCRIQTLSMLRIKPLVQ